MRNVTKSKEDPDLANLRKPGEVQDFYERYPYPRPEDSLDKYQLNWQDLSRSRADFHLSWPSRPYREDRSILIAGCGTSQAAKHALRWPNASVTGIDFSAKSISCTDDLKRKYDLQNLTLHQLRIERADELGMEFDQVVCTGVLHHLPDPNAGLIALRNVLKRNGAMHLMVYAPFGRTGIYMMQKFCSLLGIIATDESIRDLIKSLNDLPPAHPMAGLLRDEGEFQHKAALADALLHPQDRPYSVPELFEFLKDTGMKFGRWVKQAPYSIKCGAIASLPQNPRLAELPICEQYAAVELFRGAIARHSVIAYRSDSEEPDRIDFDNNAWLDHVPIRVPDTICVEDRLPDGVAGVLINRTHTFRDIYLPITANEKVWFDSIDGIRSIKEIASLPNAENEVENVRTFFEKLWWYDQVVFDASSRT